MQGEPVGFVGPPGVRKKLSATGWDPLGVTGTGCCAPVPANDCPFVWFWLRMDASHLVALPCSAPAFSGVTLTASILGDTAMVPGPGLVDTCTPGEMRPKCCRVKFTMAELGFWMGSGWLEETAGLFPTGTAAMEVGETISFKGVT